MHEIHRQLPLYHFDDELLSLLVDCFYFCYCIYILKIMTSVLLSSLYHFLEGIRVQEIARKT